MVATYCIFWAIPFEFCFWFFLSMLDLIGLCTTINFCCCWVSEDIPLGGVVFSFQRHWVVYQSMPVSNSLTHSTSGHYIHIGICTSTSWYTRQHLSTPKYMYSYPFPKGLTGAPFPCAGSLHHLVVPWPVCLLHRNVDSYWKQGCHLIFGSVSPDVR